ncbi:GPI inositol deacylase [Mortierella sp. GBA30]|nr:GPI inositol deacylase [Mortierella sp. GBA30]
MPSTTGDHRPGSKPLDFFTVGFNEEFSAFHGRLILDQAQYVNEAITYILSLYSDTDLSDFQPRSVLLIGHSMGGIVARTIFTMENYITGSVNTILTIATPHMIPPVALDYEISGIYDRIEAFWRGGYDGPHSALADVSLVSIMGGNLDVTVNSDAGNIHHIVPQSHGFSVFTSSIPHAWVGCDHLSILWCNQVVTAIGRALVDLVDARVPEQVKPLGQRMKIFRNRFLTGLEDHLHDGDHKKIPQSREEDTLTLLTSHKLGDKSRLDVLLCTEVTQETMTLSCQRDPLAAVPIPASTEASTLPLFTGEYFTEREFRFAYRHLRSLTGFQYLVVVDRGRLYFDPGFLVVQFLNEETATDTVGTTTIGLLRDGFLLSKFPEKSLLVSTLKLPNLDTSLLAYNLKVDRPGCQGKNNQRFTPMVRQSSWAMHEDKYSVNIAGRSAGIDINFHGDLPYFDKIQLGGSQGVELRFWMDPTCLEPLSLSLQVDKYGSLGKILIRYRMVVLVFTFLVVVIVLRAQIKDWSHDSVFSPFEVCLSRSIKSTFWKFSIVLGILSTLQTLKSRNAIDLHSTDYMSDLSHGNAHDAYGKLVSRITRSTSRLSSLWFEDALLGGQDAFFWFLAPVFFQLAVGIVSFVWAVLNCIVMLLAAVYKRFMTAHGGNRSYSISRQLITAALWFALVALAIPYQFAFAATVLALVMASARTLVLAQRTSGASAQIARNQYHFMISLLVMFFFLLPFFVPVLMVWIRNLAVGWLTSFTADHRVDYVAPFIIIVEGLANGVISVPPSVSQTRYSILTVGLLDVMVVYLIVFGVRYSWQIFFLTRLWVGWLLLCRLMDTETGRALESRVQHVVWSHMKDE